MTNHSPSACIELKEGTHIAPVVLMPGDPLRAKFVAEHYLEDPVLFNDVRNMLGYTGRFEGREVSVMGSDMGMPSFTLYAYELFHFFGVEAIIRIDSAGGIRDDVKLRDLIIAMSALPSATSTGRPLRARAMQETNRQVRCSSGTAFMRSISRSLLAVSSWPSPA